MLRTSDAILEEHKESQSIFAQMERAHSKYVLLTGSNLGNREAMLERAKTAIAEQIGEILEASSVHESEPWGFESEHQFLNQALLVASEMTPPEVLAAIHTIEAELGRVRVAEQMVSRTIDIDILCSDSEPFSSDNLMIPHARLSERVFALEPLCELIPNWIHPVSGKRYQELLHELIIALPTRI